MLFAAIHSLVVLAMVVATVALPLDTLLDGVAPVQPIQATNQQDALDSVDLVQVSKTPDIGSETLAVLIPSYAGHRYHKCDSEKFIGGQRRHCTTAVRAEDAAETPHASQDTYRKNGGRQRCTSR